MAADVFRRREDDDVRAVVDRLDEPDADRVVHDERNPRLVRDGGDFFEIRNIELRVADRLRVDRAGFRRDRLAKCLGVFGIHKDHLPPEFRERVVEELVAAAVEVVRRDDLVADLRDRQQRKSGCRLAGCDRERAGAAFDCGDPLLENVRCRVH